LYVYEKPTILGWTYDRINKTVLWPNVRQLAYIKIVDFQNRKIVNKTRGTLVPIVPEIMHVATSEIFHYQWCNVSSDIRFQTNKIVRKLNINNNDNKKYWFPPIFNKHLISVSLYYNFYLLLVSILLHCIFIAYI
jgi:hypothetical protein